MTQIIQCTCGAKIRLPPQARPQALRCPRCHASLAPGGSSDASPATGAEGTCPICQTPIAPGEDAIHCPECRQVHHRECWGEVGGCATYGCGQAPSQEKTAPADTPLTAWGDTKTCPVCAEKIKAIAIKCRYCGHDFDTVDPLTADDIRSRVSTGDRLRSARATVITLFVLSLVAFLAPVILVVAIIWLFTKRPLLPKLGPIYQVLIYAAIGLSVLYSLLIVGLLIFS